ncbi:hypothetical protein WR25_26974 [Diploscapter pachys]|uniref:Histone H2A/H2B/H3 domain-containing protein n=1 Tax=Diploscapter pachys TaxID=2018661 RepID=A0A2A2KLX0_9BILA|nr:hypothetical protein WR25_26974 [Diploscapter pachys]
MVRPKMAGTGGSASKKEIKNSESQMMRAGDKKKRKHSRKESFSVYVYRVLKQTAVRLILPGELSKHAVSEGTKAITKYTSSK